MRKDVFILIALSPLYMSNMSMEYADALNLLAGVVEQAHKDIYSITRQSGVDHKCMVELPHPPSRCARKFLLKLDVKVRYNHHRLTTLELAEAVLEAME